jgi:hypothetical protein
MQNLAVVVQRHKKEPRLLAPGPITNHPVSVLIYFLKPVGTVTLMAT